MAVKIAAFAAATKQPSQASPHKRETVRGTTDHPLEPVIGPAKGRARWRMMTAERVEQFTGFICVFLICSSDCGLTTPSHPIEDVLMRRMRTGRDAAPEGSASSAGPPGASGDTARPNYMGPSGNGLVGADERGGKPAESRAFRMSAAPVRFQKAVPRSKENAAVGRREARRSALWTGSSLPLEGQARP